MKSSFSLSRRNISRNSFPAQLQASFQLALVPKSPFGGECILGSFFGFVWHRFLGFNVSLRVGKVGFMHVQLYQCQCSVPYVLKCFPENLRSPLFTAIYLFSKRDVSLNHVSVDNTF